jgi:hypothetical protein
MTSGPTPSSAMALSPVRRISIGDGLVFIVALALSLAILRSTPWFSRIVPRVTFWWEAWHMLSGVSPWSAPAVSRPDLVKMVAAQMISEFSQLLSALLTGATLAMPVIRLRRPRPEMSEVIRQPGTVVCLAAIVAPVLVVDISWTFSIRIPATTIAAGSLLMLWPLSGLAPWRPEPSWVDWLGRAVGWGWIVVTAGMAGLAYL